ncbi:protein Cep78 homolog [Drosophila nasuta]|uniref:protein Cep78 homolog n=1 Tax=Drosophila nasuta TaxID=42062 RepID=UPI00295EAB72|nr:protein Cep78 homolog [Drosophila nasuta]
MNTKMPLIRGRDTIAVAKKPSVTLPPVVKKSSKSRSFHFRYLELCRAKNITPVPNIRANANSTTTLDLCGDKLGVSEWLLIIDALHHDLVLQTLVLRMRRSNGNNIVLPIDTENRARLFRQKPVIYTRFIFNSLVEAIVNCVKSNKNLTVLKLEALPLQDSYIECIAKALASNDCLKELSFQKSFIGDKGCAAVCSTVKYLNHIEIFNLSECNLGPKGAEHVADMIKMQKISRFSEGWEKSLRYRSVDVNSIAGLRHIALSNNPIMGDDGLRLIAEVLKEDAWVQTMEMESCGLTDRGANLILECLALNNAITEFNIRNNDGISKFLMRQIRDHLGKEDEEKLKEPQYDLSCVNGLQSLPKNQKYSVSQLLNHTKTLEEQLSFERTLRKKAEKLNEKLNQQLLSQGPCSPQPHPQPQQQEKLIDGAKIPKGYMLVKGDELQSFIKNTQNYSPSSAAQFNHLVNSAVTSPETTPRSDNTTLRNQLSRQMHQQQQHQLVEMDETEETAMASEPQQQPRQILHVRKVRSEMKYVETYSKENSKKRESKSDHEFANERDFKLNPNVQFEMDIGDSAMINPQQHNRIRCEVREDMEQEMLQESYNAQYSNECIGDGVENNRKHKEKFKKRMNAMGQSHMTQFMDELERKINSKSSSKKRHKSKVPTNAAESYNNEKQGMNMKVDSYMPIMEDMPEGSEENSSASDGDNSEDMPQGQAQSQGYTTAPMKVFVRRTRSVNESSMDQLDGEESEETIISPRSVYLDIQKKKNEGNH